MYKTYPVLFWIILIIAVTFFLISRLLTALSFAGAEYTVSNLMNTLYFSAFALISGLVMIRVLLRKPVKKYEDTFKAEKPYTEWRKLKRLSKDEDIKIRIAVAKNPNTPLSALFELLSEGGELAESVMKNPNFSMENYIEEFLRDDDLRSLLRRSTYSLHHHSRR